MTVFAVLMISMVTIIPILQIIDEGSSASTSDYHIWVGSVDQSGEADIVTVYVAVFNDPEGLPEGTVVLEGIGYVVKDDGILAYAPISGVESQTIESGTTVKELTFTLPIEQNVYLVHAIYTSSEGTEIQSMSVYPNKV